MLTDAYRGPERRAAIRAIRTFKPIYVEADDKSTVGVMRDISTDGVGFEADVGFKVGQELRYRWGDEPFVSGKVIWTGSGRFGIAHDEPLSPASLEPKRYRSVRVPILREATIYLDGRGIPAETVNFSQKGFCTLASERIRHGALVTLKVGNRFFERATAKWSADERVGFAIPEPLPVAHMSSLMAGQ